MQLWSHVGRRIHHIFCIASERLNVDARWFHLDTILRPVKHPGKSPCSHGLAHVHFFCACCQIV